MSRRDLVARLAELAGPAVQVEDLRDGWPGILRVEGIGTRVAAHLGPIGLSHRKRDAVERRFQNPGQRRPVTSPRETVPVLIGIWEPEGHDKQPVLVGMEVTEHRLVASTRQSYFVPLQLLREAQALGWADHLSTSEEHITALQPGLLPVYLEARINGVRLPGRVIASIAQASGLVGEGAQESSEDRARRAASVLIRNEAFSKRVISAYDGLCAMCGLDFGLLEGAHILPVAAPGSPDEIWNGLALCRNHHGAFDRHLIWVRPTSREIRFHPRVLEEGSRNQMCSLFIERTETKLRAPSLREHYPRSEMLEMRYEFYDDAYDWAD